MAGSLIATNFERFAQIFSPSLTGGVLNLVFKPTEIPESTEPVLTLNDINMDIMISYAKALMLTTKQEHPVLDVLPAEVKPDEVKNSTYIIELIILGVAFLLTLGLWIGTLVIPCIFCCSKKKRDSDGGSSKGCLIAMGVVTGVLVIFLALCLPLVYVAITSLVAGIDGKATGGENAGLKNTVHVVVNETSVFLRDIPKRGRSVTTGLLKHLQSELTTSLSQLVKEILEQLLTRYNVNTLVDGATALSERVTGLQNMAEYVVGAKETTIKEIETFQNGTSHLQEDLKTNLQKLCSELPPLSQKNECVAMSIKTSFDLTEKLDPMLQLWDKVSTEVSEPVIQQLDQIEPTVDDALAMAAKFTKIGGFVILILFTAVLVIILVFGIITAVQAAKDSKGPKCCLCCGLILPVVFCFLIPVLVLISGVLVVISGLIANEGCRYVGNPSGVVVTDGALNLYVQYMWPHLLSDQLVDPSITAMLDIPLPKNVLDGILIKCKSEENGSRSTNPGLLPSLGIDHFLNATAIVEQPDLQTAIKDTEQGYLVEVTTEIRDTSNTGPLQTASNFSHSIPGTRPESRPPEIIQSEQDSPYAFIN
ncbi:hypothetical protein CRM22_011079 [Opisthorchis felineus]|uniref:Protein tweety homolog n=1 Tax=Opisthorchis felineus TaxID=147828 RepID=A0A4S2KBN3_OPIFE|nr:hypothetical protein CRM22_011079 [Opisthorchis felineus]